MENRERIRKMSDQQLADFLKEVSKNYMLQFYDMQRWLRQENYDPVYIGKKGWYLKGEADADEAIIRHEKMRNPGLVLPCKIIEKRRAFGKDYTRIVVGNELMDVQARYVKEQG